MMSKIWLILVALWKIAIWKVKKDEGVQKKRDELKKGVKDAIKNDNTRDLHRIMSRL